MPTIRRLTIAAPALALLALGAHPSVVKDGTGVYAIIDRVVFEPDARNPERVQLWGVFRVADTFAIEDGRVSRMTFGGFHPVVRGYMYFEVNPDHPRLSRQEWWEFARHAGTGEPVAFGTRVPTPDTASPFAGRLDSSSMYDTAYIGWIMRYNGRVRTVDDEVSDPDIYPIRMGALAPPLLVDRTLPEVLPLTRAAGQGREAGPEPAKGVVSG